MPERLGTKLKHAWNAFKNRDPTSDLITTYQEVGPSSYSRPDRPMTRLTNEKSMVISLYNRIALDVADILIQHVRLDQNGRYEETITSGLNSIFSLEANIDQTGKAFIQDIVMSMFDEGCVALVPIDTSLNPKDSTSYDIQTMRTGQIMEWYPKHVRIRVYNDISGKKQEMLFPKTQVGIIENPLYAVMNQPNSTLQRLIRKLGILDVIDEQSGSGKLDIIIQLPYVIKTTARREQAEARRKDIEVQLSGSKYGIAYTDGTEKITQLNRPAENNLMATITYLTSTLYSQLGVTEAVFLGTADEKTMLNYFNRSLKPIISAIVDESKRKFLTKTARTQNQSILYFRDAFSLIPANELANVADKFTRNEILTSNEIRGVIGFKPVKKASADELRNKNLNASDQLPKEQPSKDANKLKGEQIQDEQV